MTCSECRKLTDQIYKLKDENSKLKQKYELILSVNNKVISTIAKAAKIQLNNRKKENGD